MLKRLSNNHKAQVISAEYVLIFVLILAVMSAMTIYFRRSIQARIRDAGQSMGRTVQSRTAGYGVNAIYTQYEPYYLNTITDIDRSEFSRTRILPGGTTGIFRKDVDDYRAIRARSVTSPPKDAD